MWSVMRYEPRDLEGRVSCFWNLEKSQRVCVCMCVYVCVCVRGREREREIGGRSGRLPGHCWGCDAEIWRGAEDAGGFAGVRWWEDVIVR